MELTPRTAPGAPVSERRPRRPWAYVVLGAVLVAVAVIAYQGLTSASLYFYNADEAVEERDELGSKRIRVQGVVQDDVEADDEELLFTIRFNDQAMPVRHDGNPPEMFRPGTPVVLEGRWAAAGDRFESDEILVKHDEEYEADNGDRLADAEDGEKGGSASP